MLMNVTRFFFFACKQKALEQANDAKAEGNALFKEGQYEDALTKYEFALQVAPEMPSSLELRSICHANRAICFLKLVSFYSCDFTQTYVFCFEYVIVLFTTVEKITAWTEKLQLVRVA